MTELTERFYVEDYSGLTFRDTWPDAEAFAFERSAEQEFDIHAVAERFEDGEWRVVKTLHVREGQEIARTAAE